MPRASLAVADRGVGAPGAAQLVPGLWQFAGPCHVQEDQLDEQMAARERTLARFCVVAPAAVVPAISSVLDERFVGIGVFRLIGM